jgi:hypothetical protein
MTGDESQSSPGAGGSWQFKPGDTIDASGQVTQSEPGTATASGLSPQPDESNEPAPQNSPMQLAPDAENPKGSQETVRWTASEFIVHQKNIGWYLVLFISAVALTGLVYLFTRDKISSAVVVIAAIIFGIYAARKPRTVGYQLNPHGLSIGEKFYDYASFRSFAVVDEGAFSSVAFMPLKRFMPAISIYYDPADEEKIVRVLSDRLPMENRGHDLIDRFLHAIRF